MRTLLFQDLQARLLKNKLFSEALNSLAVPGQHGLHGLHGSFAALFLAVLHHQSKHPMLVVASTDVEAKQLVSNFAAAGIDALFFPFWNAAVYRPGQVSSLIYGQRASILANLALERAPVVVCSHRSLAYPVPEPAYLWQRMRTVSPGQKIDTVGLSAFLTGLSYQRVPRVSVAGEFALRGEVLDVFLPGDAMPVRVVFDFDTVRSVRYFDIHSQQTCGALDVFVLHPMREAVWDEDTLGSLAVQTNQLGGAFFSESLRERLQTGAGPGDDFLWFPLIHERPRSLLDHLSADTVRVFLDSERLPTLDAALTKESSILHFEASRDQVVPPPERLFQNCSQLAETPGRTLMLYRTVEDGSKDGFGVMQGRSFFGNVTLFKSELAAQKSEDLENYLLSESESQTVRLEQLFSDDPVHVEELLLSEGFTSKPLGLSVVTETELFGRKKRSAKPQGPAGFKTSALDSFVELAPGDFVVHIQHGIGRFREIRRMRAAGMERDYICLEYAERETVFIPTDQVNLIHKFIGNEGNDPPLDRIGSKSWENRKKKVQKNVEDLAGRLIALYSRRQSAQGYAFPPDGEWQNDFEARFPYEETQDQLQCIADVKADLERTQPMDRLICGDVGYGKTEIAFRAVFKAVTGGKQAAFLCPTTILTEQQYESFLERIQGFPVRSAMLSRFVSKKEIEKALLGLASGELDVVFGTHRLLQKDVRFKQLGLLVIDEEQRFGVKDKERLKEMKATVDCLTLSATPIPRTLHMAMLKIRDMSVLKTPPQNRLPIETHIHEYDPVIVSAAIRKEVGRGGQVYYLHNRIESLQEIMIYLQNLMPEIIFASAHGRMAPDELEDIMHRFIHQGVQVLVSTTIIENGINIPNVNTIIIDRADMYGISQLYQLRGRVGRSDRKAYAYLLYPDKLALSEIAMKRLSIISDHTELGAGFKIAMKDLEVRGAGNLLGREQSGDIMSVGFDLYLRLLDEAVRKLQGSGQVLVEDAQIELEYSGFIPDVYIPQVEEKLELYQKIATIEASEELEALTDEIRDRFGPPPVELESLVYLAELRLLCRDLAILSIIEKRGTAEIEFGKIASLSANRVMTLLQQSKGSIKLDPKRANVMRVDVSQVALETKSKHLCDLISRLKA